jgi:TonB family protein
MRHELKATSESNQWLGYQNLIVPPDIIPVRRVSPVVLRRRTICWRHSDGQPVCRTGDRQWLGEGIFADARTQDVRRACASTVAVHVTALALLLVLLSGQPAPTAPRPVGPPLRMPVFVAVLSASSGGTVGAALITSPAPLRASVPARRATAPTRRETTDDAKNRAAQPVGPVVAAPSPALTAPDAEQHTTAEQRVEGESAPAAPSETGAGGTGQPSSAPGASGGDGTAVGGRAGDGLGSGGSSRGPYLLDQGVEPPRKIKEVLPSYPANAMVVRAAGTVVIEAIVDADGKVQAATVVGSVPHLDQAALDAVRQWEFAPGRLNGVAVSVIIRVLVKFSLY